MNFEQSSEFQKELKSLLKKWRSLETDLEVACKVIGGLYAEGNEEVKNLFFSSKKATILQQMDDKGREVIKMRLDCVALGSKDILRIIFICVVTEKKVMFVELYAKNQKSREDQLRIKKYLSDL